MKQYRYQFDEKKKHRCPSCGHQGRFVRMIDKETGELLPANVGRCDRENKCGYYYHATDWVKDNAQFGDQYRPYVHQVPTVVQKPVYYIPDEVFLRTLNKYEQNNFVSYLNKVFGPELTAEVVQRYFIGTSKRWNGSTLFWLVDTSGRVRTGKIMLYDAGTGKRVKNAEGRGYIDWAHRHTGETEPNMVQCFFGEHLLKARPGAPVGIVESQKTAVIASLYLPEYVWLATGGASGCKWVVPEVARALEGRDVTLFPDSGYAGRIKGQGPNEKATAFELWSHKAPELCQAGGCKSVQVSGILEKISGQEWENGQDLADYLLRFPLSAFTQDTPSTPEAEPLPAEVMPVQQNTPEPMPTVQVQPSVEYTKYVQNQGKRNRVVTLTPWDNEIKELLDFFADIPHVSLPFTFPAGGTIHTAEDLARFIASHLNVVQANNGTPAFRPYLDRLNRIRQAAELKAAA